MANLKRGSTGEEVAEVQRIVGVKDDGIFGPDTEAAVKQYQKNNGLAADGIVGPDTRGVMFKTTKTNTGGNTGTKPATPSGAAPVTSPGGVTYGDFTYDSFDPGSSETIQQAQTLLDQNNANRPGAWVDPYQSQYMDYLNKYANRDPFSYDFNSDALYQQYRDNYILQGQMAMMDTMGQAAAMTGGYGNSYAQSVGQQAYNQHLNQLNDIIPELYGMAYDRYQQEGQDLLNMYGIYKGLSDDSYGRYQDDVDNWYREDTRLTNNYNTAYGQEWDKYSLGYDTAWSKYLTDRSESKNTTGGNGNTGGKQYKDIDVGSTAYNTMTTKINRVTSVPQLQALVQEYLALGYNPDQIEALTAGKYNELMPEVNPPKVPINPTGSVGGGGGGRHMVVAK